MAARRPGSKAPPRSTIKGMPSIYDRACASDGCKNDREPRSLYCDFCNVINRPRTQAIQAELDRTVPTSRGATDEIPEDFEIPDL